MSIRLPGMKTCLSFSQLLKPLHLRHITLRSTNMLNSTLFIACSCSPLKSLSFQTPSSSPHLNLHLRFHTSYRENLRYLKSLGISKIKKDPTPESLLQILTTINFLKSKGFSEPHFARLASVFPQLLSPEFDPSYIQRVLEFLNDDLAASPEESRLLILRCPSILKANVEFCLRPTLSYLRELGLENLNSPTTLSAHLLNTRVEKLVKKVKFLQSLGLSYEESAKVCARFPAIFGYSIENNLLPKFEYLVGEMDRGVEELKEFPQYFAFSLRKRIIPRHLHLKQRNARVPLRPMLLWSDQRFYAKWK